MKTNKKGFTLVELVIVIAVIAILAAVLLPTFSGIIARAKKNAAYQEATSVREEFLGQYLDTPAELEGVVIYVLKNAGDAETTYAFKVATNEKNGKLTDGDNVTVASLTTNKLTYNNGTVILVYPAAIASKVA